MFYIHKELDTKKNVLDCLNEMFIKELPDTVIIRVNTTQEYNLKYYMNIITLLKNVIKEL